MTPVILGTATDYMAVNLATVWFVRRRPDSATIYFHHRCPEVVVTDPGELAQLDTRLGELATPVAPGGGSP